jgi:hypothetical protein
MAIKIENLQYLQIGVQGENAASSIEFDMTSWVEQFPGAAFHLLFKPYNSLDIFPMVTEYDADTKILRWTPTLPATATPGVGYTEIRAMYDEGGMLKKSRIVPTTVENSVSGVEGGTVPLPYEDWVNLVLSYKTAAETAARNAEAYDGEASAYAQEANRAKTLAQSASAAAANSQVAAEDARTGAQNAQTNAALSRDSARQAESNANSAKTAAQTAKNQAANSATAAASSATSAETAMNEAISAKETAVAKAEIATTKASEAAASAAEAAEATASKADKEDTVLLSTLSKGRLASSDVGSGSIAYGSDVTASGLHSHAEGDHTIANRAWQHVFGRYNEEDPAPVSGSERGYFIEIVGNGDENSRSDARTLDWYGNECLQGTIEARNLMGREELILSDGSEFVRLDGSTLKRLLALLN